MPTSSTKTDINSESDNSNGNVFTFFDFPYTKLTVPSSDSVPSSHNPFQKLDIYLPPTPSTNTTTTTSPPPLPPLLIFLHGGAWKSNDRTKFRSLGYEFAKRGIACIIPGYRLSTPNPETQQPEVQYPSHVEDAAAAVAMSLALFDSSWRSLLKSNMKAGMESTETDLLKHLEEFEQWLKGDVERGRFGVSGWYAEGRMDKVYVCGHSAGAQMGGMLSLRRSYVDDALERLFSATNGGKWDGGGGGGEWDWQEKMKGFVGCEGIFDIPLMVKNWPTYREWFVELAFGKEDLGKWADGSPSLQDYETPAAGNGHNKKTNKKIPHLVIFSLNDELLDAPQSQGWVEHLKRLGTRVEYVEGGVVQGKHDEVLAETGFFDTVEEYITMV
jgi:acetyl esterase/lipase